MTSMLTAPWVDGRHGTCYLLEWGFFQVRAMAGKAAHTPILVQGPGQSLSRGGFYSDTSDTIEVPTQKSRFPPHSAGMAFCLRNWLVKTAGWWRPWGYGSCSEPREPQKGALPPCVRLRRGQDGFVIRPQASPAVVSPATLYHSDPRWSLVKNTLKCN